MNFSFEKDVRIDRIITGIEIYSGQKIIPENTFAFFSRFIPGLYAFQTY